MNSLANLLYKEMKQVKKKAVISIITCTAILGAIWSVYASVPELQVFSKKQIFYADSDFMIEVPSLKGLRLEKMDAEKGKEIVNSLLEKNQNGTRIEIEVEGETVAFAKGESDIYNIPLANSPYLYRDNKKQNYFTVGDRLFRINHLGEELIKLSGEEFNGMTREELAQRGYLHWVANPMTSHGKDAIYYTSNRRGLALENDDSFVDLWKVDFNRGVEELVAEDSSEYLGENEKGTIVAYSKRNGLFDIGIAETSERIIFDVYPIGSDKKYVYYEDYDKGSVLKHNLLDGEIEEIIDLNKYVTGRVALSPERNVSFILTGSRAIRAQQIFITHEDKIRTIELPEGFEVQNMHWVDEYTLLITGYLNESGNDITYKLEIGRSE
jgi:hypothetical protein